MEYIQIYATSVESPDEKDKSSQKAWELYQYLERNRKVCCPTIKGDKDSSPAGKGFFIKGWVCRKIRIVR